MAVKMEREGENLVALGQSVWVHMEICQKKMGCLCPTFLKVIGTSVDQPGTHKSDKAGLRLLYCRARESKGRVTQTQEDHCYSAAGNAERQRGLQQGCHGYCIIIPALTQNYCKIMTCWYAVNFVRRSHKFTVYQHVVILLCWIDRCRFSLQCFDTVGLVTGSTSSTW